MIEHEYPLFDKMREQGKKHEAMRSVQELKVVPSWLRKSKNDC